jgi:hypothetical protein
MSKSLSTLPRFFTAMKKDGKKTASTLSIASNRGIASKKRNGSKGAYKPGAAPFVTERCADIQPLISAITCSLPMSFSGS